MTVAATTSDDRAFCVAMLPKVSRTFAICIRLLPSDLERSVLVAYLLCRIADTLEDSTRLPADRRASLLGRFAAALDGDEAIGEEIGAAFSDPRTDEEALVSNAPSVLRVFRALPASHRDGVTPWVQEMCTGMASFVNRKADDHALTSLTTVEDLDRYCYYVAGTVGHLLTALFRAHYRLRDGRRLSRLQALAPSFGLGLQLTNIIKDVADDRRRGWSFVPRQICDLVGIRPEDLQDQAHGDEGRRALQILIDKAKRHLADALEYCTRLPRRDGGVRQFCLTSLYFAVQTLRLAEHDAHLLDPDHKVKITRARVARTVVVTKLIAPSNTAIRTYYRWLAGPGWTRSGHSPIPATT